jgi:hypothetical protein
MKAKKEVSKELVTDLQCPENELAALVIFVR